METSFREFLNLTVTRLLEQIGFSGAEVKTNEMAEGSERVAYHTEIVLPENQNLLIGQHGANIAALLHIVRLIARKEQPENTTISLDVNHYFHEKKVYLKREALTVAKEVEATGLPATLRPMLPFERKLVHTLFAMHPTLTTESVGQGEERKVLIKSRPTAPEEEGLAPLVP